MTDQQSKTDIWVGLDTSKKGWETLPKELDPRWKELLSRPRVIKARDIPSKVKEGHMARRVDVDKVGLGSFVIFFEEFSPKGVSQRHGHLNEAVFYALKGRGYEIHDGEKFEWEAGDVIIIPAGCVHRHVNSDPENPAQVLVINPKPQYLLTNLSAQRLVDAPSEGSI